MSTDTLSENQELPAVRVRILTLTVANMVSIAVAANWGVAGMVLYLKQLLLIQIAGKNW